MTDIIVIAVVAAMVGGAVLYIYRQKKKGARCIGCSMAGSCGKASQGSCSCSSEQ